jgi:protein tyrosine/serine phosphatase
MKRSIALRAAAAMLAVVALPGAYAGYLHAAGNFHVVLSGELYRSAQPTTAQLEAYIRQHGIRTVINLRGPSGRDWYADEVRTARMLGAEHVDFRMSASQILTPERADALMAIMEAAPKPILLHCQGGADRTGLASALYSYRIAQRGESFAESQLSFYYGHLGLPYISAAWAMDVSWENLEALPGEADASTAEGGMPTAAGMNRS